MMSFPQDQIDELKKVAPDLSLAEEGGYTFMLIKNLALPDGCKPSAVNALLCPTPREGYTSRLFFAEQISGAPAGRNWNGNIRVLGQNWYAISWQISQPNLRLIEILSIQLNALRP